MIPAQLIEMLQDRMNKIVNPDWMTAGYNWSRAMLVESVELLDHIGWKWWKSQTPNIAQAQMEVIDLWHFMLSRQMIVSGGIQAAALAIIQDWNKPLDKVYLKVRASDAEVPMLQLPLLRRVELFGSLAGATDMVVYPLFRSIAESLNLDDTDLFEQYMSKNALNQFRQANGYKEGTYIKDWNGREDNEVLTEIVNTVEDLTFQSLMNELGKAYQAVLDAKAA